ncbi:MAG: hypothetical protein EP335_00515 [Alphaproteobacteria bacterium]|nr:MAG: hypothetical protein EP335_00515 [Alphaproteobacteria bacterium]
MQRKLFAATLLTFCLLGDGNAVIAADKKGLEARLWEATDARDATNPVFDEAVKAGKFDALEMLGQIGGDACNRLVPYLSDASDEIVLAARSGAAMCQDTALAQTLLANGREIDGEWTVRHYREALGFSGGAAARPQLIADVNALKVDDDPAVMADTLFGLLQSVVYDRLEADKVSDLDFPHVLALTANELMGYHAAYLLTRFQGVETVLDRVAVEAALAKAQDHTKVPLVRVLAQFGDGAAPKLLALSQAGPKAVQREAVRGMGKMTDAATRKYLMGLAETGKGPRRHLAIQALGARVKGDPAVEALLSRIASTGTGWGAVSAIEALQEVAPATVAATAKRWLEGADYYLAYKATLLLSGSEDGKAVLKAYVNAHPGTVRAHDAAVALDPAIEADTKPRPTVPYRETKSYIGKQLRLVTSKGPIIIDMYDATPYTVTNFLKLAEAGKMNGMLWHRVIPNFVAQAGQIEDADLANWGSIREEWFASQHLPGTVGVATAGRDTGGTQFFINTNYNLHLNGRYTVFGQVIEGMDVAEMLEEGDKIIKAEVLKGEEVLPPETVVEPDVGTE